VRINVGAAPENGYVEMSCARKPRAFLIPTRDAPKIIAAKVKELYDSLK